MHKNFKKLLIFMTVAVLFGGLFFANESLKQSLSFFYDVKDAVTKKNEHHMIRIGGLVKAKSDIVAGDMSAFILTDTENEIEVHYKKGMDLPPMFAIGKGAIVRGKFNNDGVFIADKIFAKHDETYRPPKKGEKVLINSKH